MFRFTWISWNTSSVWSFHVPFKYYIIIMLVCLYCTANKFRFLRMGSRRFGCDVKCLIAFAVFSSVSFFFFSKRDFVSNNEAYEAQINQNKKNLHANKKKKQHQQPNPSWDARNRYTGKTCPSLFTEAYVFDK